MDQDDKVLKFLVLLCIDLELQPPLGRGLSLAHPPELPRTHPDPGREEMGELAEGELPEPGFPHGRIRRVPVDVHALLGQGDPLPGVPGMKPHADLLREPPLQAPGLDPGGLRGFRNLGAPAPVAIGEDEGLDHGGREGLPGQGTEGLEAEEGGQDAGAQSEQGFGTQPLLHGRPVFK